MVHVLGIDVGGSGIKGALVDVESGDLTCKHIRLETPRSFEAGAVSQTIARLVDKFEYEGVVGIGFPAVVSGGVVLTPPTAHEISGWVGGSVNDLFSAATGCPVTVLNDADAAGLAEMRFGAGKRQLGVVITITLGTGVGAGLFIDGRLVPNLELGKVFLSGHASVVEQYVASRIKTEQELSWDEYSKRLNKFCLFIERVFSPQMIIVGGGISKKHEKFLPTIELTRTPLVPAKLFNQAGISGAAVWAAETI